MTRLQKRLKTTKPATRAGFNVVPRTGIEPALPCDNQILSLARLPVPPSGLFLLKNLLYRFKIKDL